MPVVLFVAVILMWAGSNGSSRQTCRFLSATVSTWREAEFERDIDSDSRPKSGTRRTSLWRKQRRQIKKRNCGSQTGFRGAAAIASELDNSTKGTSSGTRVLTRSPRYSTDKADVNGGFDWRAQFGGCT